MRLLSTYMVLLSFIYFTFLCGLKLLHCVDSSPSVHPSRSEHLAVSSRVSVDRVAVSTLAQGCLGCVF